MRAVSVSGLAGFADHQILKQYVPLRREADDYVRQQWRCLLEKVHERAEPFDGKSAEALWVYKTVADRLEQADVGTTYGEVDWRFYDFAEREERPRLRRLGKLFDTVDYQNQMFGLDWRRLMDLRDRYRTLVRALSPDDMHPRSDPVQVQ